MKRVLFGLVFLTQSGWGLPWIEQRRPHYHPSALILESSLATAQLGANSPMRVRMYLPPDYNPQSDLRYPVMYALDGQNVFEPDPLAGDSAQEWCLDERLEQLTRTEQMQPIFVCAVDTRAMRIEYFPSLETFSESQQLWQGGKAAQMLAFLQELKAEVDRDFRTRSDDTGIMGSSLGGLFALHAGFKQPQHYQRVAALSPSLWWSRRPRTRGGEPLVNEAMVGSGPQRLWLDMGDHEVSGGTVAEQQAEAAENIQLARDFAGWVTQSRPADRSFCYQEFVGDDENDHSEASWSRRLLKILPWLYPPVAQEP